MSPSKELVLTGPTIKRTVTIPKTRRRPQRDVEVEIPETVANAYPAISQVEKIAELFDEMFSDGESLGVGDFTRIKVPSGDSNAFAIGDDAAKTFTGVIILHQDRRNYWKLSPEEAGGTQAPDCYSRDAVHGVGVYGKGSTANPTGLCASCPMAQWVEVDGERIPSPCKPQKAILAMVEGKAFPVLLMVPRTSLRPFKDYWKQDLFMNGLKSYAQVVTEFGLAKDTGGKVTFNRITFKEVQDLGNDVKNVMLHLGEQYRSVLANVDTAMDTEVAATPTQAQPVDEEGGLVIDDDFADPVDDQPEYFADPADMEEAYTR